jgi:small subunit ribosomal protein S16
MALKIKLTRIGRKNNPKYRIVIAEAHSRRDGAYLENVGTYDPIAKENNINVKKDRIDYWISKGAQFTKGTQRLLTAPLRNL